MIKLSISIFSPFRSEKQLRYWRTHQWFENSLTSLALHTCVCASVHPVGVCVCKHVCVRSCGSSSGRDIAVIKEVNSSLCICVCVWVNPWRASVAVREQWDACWTNQTCSTTVWIRHIGGTKGQGLLAAVKTAIQTSPSLHSAKGIVQIPPTILPTHLFISLIYSSFDPENNAYCNSWNCVEL